MTNYKLIEVKKKEKLRYCGSTHDLSVEEDCSYVANGVVVHNSMCKTRVITGVGKPQFSTIYDAVNLNYTNKKIIMSDGGIREFGDVAKAFGVGADFVMIGTLFAGFKDNTVNYSGETHTKVYGMASKSAHEKYYPHLKATPEGMTEMIPVRESLEEYVEDLLGGLRSTLTYTGHKNLSDFIGDADFYRVNRVHHRE